MVYIFIFYIYFLIIFTLLLKIYNFSLVITQIHSSQLPIKCRSSTFASIYFSVIFFKLFYFKKIFFIKTQEGKNFFVFFYSYKKVLLQTWIVFWNLMSISVEDDFGIFLNQKIAETKF